MAEEPADPDPADGPVITTFVFKVRNIPAALYKALGGFATNGINMLKLESYLEDESFTSAQFYADVEGHPDETALRLALEELGFLPTATDLPLGVNNLVYATALLYSQSSIRRRAIESRRGRRNVSSSGEFRSCSRENQSAVSSSSVFTVRVLLAARA